MNQLMTAFQKGGTFVLINFVFAREIVQALLKERITGLAGVPTLWSLLAQPNSTLQSSPFRTCVTSRIPAAQCRKPCLKVLRQALPTTKVFLMYGLTEAFRSTYLPPEELDRRPNFDGQSHPRHGNSCAQRETASSASPEKSVNSCIADRPSRWAIGIVRRIRLAPCGQILFCLQKSGDCERVCYSGDLVKMDEDGFLYFVGRRDTMIKSSGFRISPTEVEEVLFQTGKLRGAAVIGIPDEVLGQVIKAFVVAKDGDPLDTDALLAICAEKMPRYMVPKFIEVLSELPKTSSGKVDYPALRRREGL